nr:4374_t:CDS:2 [Entrophospora candida]
MSKLPENYTIIQNKDKHFAPIWDILHNPNATAKQKAQILQEAHDNPTSGHLGHDKTYERITRTYYWLCMSKDVKKYVTTCESCQRNKATNQQPVGYDAIVVFVDRLSKRAHFIPLTTDATAPNDEHLSASEFTYNNSKQASTKMTPFELDNGQHPMTPLELIDSNTTKVEAAENLYIIWKNNLQTLSK